jgi:hypothetical protein
MTAPVPADVVAIVVGMAPASTGDGYWIVATNGTVVAPASR